MFSLTAEILRGLRTKLVTTLRRETIMARKLLGWRKRRKAEAIRAAKEAGELSQAQPSKRGMLGLEFVRDDVKSFLDKEGVEPRPGIRISEHLGNLWSRSLYAISLIFREKEIILFAALQWIVIALLYYVWVQAVGWVPMEVWRSESKIYNIALNLAFFAWSYLCVTLAAYPIGLFTGCMGAAHFLREQGHSSTIAACLKIALPNAGRLWAFATVDGWITVDQFLERLPKKRGRPTPAQRAISEALYYAWKVGTIGVVPAILTGKDLIEAGRESVSLVKGKLKDVLALRGGYSAVCWIIGIAGYIGGLFFAFLVPVFEGKHPFFTFYLWMGIPLLVAVGAVKLFVRPIFVIASFKLYSDYLKERNKEVIFDRLPGRAASSFVVFLVLCLVTFVVYLFREEVGLMRILRVG